MSVTAEDALALVDYHYWARDRMLDAVAVLTPEQYTKDLGNSFSSVRDTVVHTYGAEWIWYQRWAGASPRAFPDAALCPDVATVRTAWTAHEEKLRLFTAALGSRGELDRVFEYRLLNGDQSTSVFRHMLQHLVNHASYHRGQVTTMLRQLGAPAPEPQDLIRFYRERPPAAR